MKTLQTFTKVPTPHNCPRCGSDFQGVGRPYLCSACRAEAKKKKRTRRPRGSSELTDREKQIANLVCQAQCNKEIANTLHLTVGTVKESVHDIFRKAGVGSRAELMLKCNRPAPAPIPAAPVHLTVVQVAIYMPGSQYSYAYI